MNRKSLQGEPLFDPYASGTRKQEVVVAPTILEPGGYRPEQAPASGGVLSTDARDPRDWQHVAESIAGFGTLAGGLEFASAAIPTEASRQTPFERELQAGVELLNRGRFGEAADRFVAAQVAKPDDYRGFFFEAVCRAQIYEPPEFAKLAGAKATVICRPAASLSGLSPAVSEQLGYGVESLLKQRVPEIQLLSSQKLEQVDYFLTVEVRQWSVASGQGRARLHVSVAAQPNRDRSVFEKLLPEFVFPPDGAGAAESDSVFQRQFALAAAEQAARLFYETEQLPTAAKAMDLAVALAPQELELFVHRGNLRLRQKEYGLAVDDFTHVVRKQPQNVAALLNRAVANFHRRRPKDVLADATAVIELRKDIPDAFLLRALGNVMTGEPARARRDFDAAVAAGLSPQAVETWRPVFYR